MNYPYYQPQMMQMQIPQQQPTYRPNTSYVDQSQFQIGIKGHPVSSIEEVRATSIDFDGSVFYFPDLANKRIYTKQINLDGTSTLNVYELKNIPIESTINASQFVTREEFEQAFSNLQASLNATPQSAAAPQPQLQSAPKPEAPQIKF